MPHLRELGPTDLKSVLSINQTARPAVGELDLARLDHLVGESSIALCVEEAGQIAGFCLVLAPGADYDSVNYTWFSARYHDFIYLDRVAIVADHRGRGLGRALYREVERLARVRRPHASTFTLEVNLRPRNDPSLRFHDRMGFVEVGRQETPYGAEVSLMAKPLPSEGERIPAEHCEHSRRCGGHPSSRAGGGPCGSPVHGRAWSSASQSG